MFYFKRLLNQTQSGLFDQYVTITSLDSNSVFLQGLHDYTIILTTVQDVALVRPRIMITMMKMSIHPEPFKSI